MSWLEILAVAAIIGFVLAGIPFAPERDGRTFGTSGGAGRDRSARY